MVLNGRACLSWGCVDGPGRRQGRASREGWTGRRAGEWTGRQAGKWTGKKRTVRSTMKTSVLLSSIFFMADSACVADACVWDISAGPLSPLQTNNDRPQQLLLQAGGKAKAWTRTPKAGLKGGRPRLSCARLPVVRG